MDHKTKTEFLTVLTNNNMDLDKTLKEKNVPLNEFIDYISEQTYLHKLEDTFSGIKTLLRIREYQKALSGDIPACCNIFGECCKEQTK